ncbi:hypothetical protein [Catellatospora vulcania]|uniref:hypothetical protein n=1 Tax=Catellatospora vulcania TaxID=1460450 RepID=UPI0012D412D4|nr:hypothetical protein [Catellatospora vulcania]
MALPEWMKATVVSLAAAGAAVVCTPWPVKLVPDVPGSGDYDVPATWQYVAQPVALALIAFAAGRWNLSVLVTGLGVTVPAAAVYGVHSEYFTDAAGADPWPASTVVLVPLAFGAAVGLAAFGRLLRRRRARARATRAVA